MTKVEKVAGIDVSKAFLDVCLLAAEGETRNRFSNDRKGFVQLAGCLDEDTHCVLEVTGPYYLRAATYLHQNGFRVSVVNPLVIRRFCQMRLVRAKTDKADARLIALYGLSERPPAWSAPEACITALQQLDAISEQLAKQRTALSNQLAAFAQSGALEKDVKQFLRKTVKAVEKQQAWVEKQTEARIEKQYAALLKSLTSIPGLGKKTAAVLIALTNGFQKFASAKQLCAYVGLAPRIFQSGSSVKGRPRICKMGMGRIRALLYLCAWSAKRYNQACKELYERLLQKGKAKKLALIAVANKLLKQAFAIATKATTYNPDHAKKICP